MGDYRILRHAIAACLQLPHLHQGTCFYIDPGANCPAVASFPLYLNLQIVTRVATVIALQAGRLFIVGNEHVDITILIIIKANDTTALLIIYNTQIKCPRVKFAKPPGSNAGGGIFGDIDKAAIALILIKPISTGTKGYPGIKSALHRTIADTGHIPVEVTICPAITSQGLGGRP